MGYKKRISNYSMSRKLIRFENANVFSNVLISENTFRINTNNLNENLNIHGGVLIEDDAMVSNIEISEKLTGNAILQSNVWVINGTDIHSSLNNVSIGTSVSTSGLYIHGDAFTLPRLSTDPINPVNGMMYYNNVSNKLKFYVNNNWVSK